MEWITGLEPNMCGFWSCLPTLTQPWALWDFTSLIKPQFPIWKVEIVIILTSCGLRENEGSMKVLSTAPSTQYRLRKFCYCYSIFCGPSLVRVKGLVEKDLVLEIVSPQVSNRNSVTVVWNLSQFFHLWNLKMIFAVHTQPGTYTASEVNADTLCWKVEGAICGHWVIIASQRQSPSLFSEVRVGRANLWTASLNLNSSILFQMQFNIYIDFHSEIFVK